MRNSTIMNSKSLDTRQKNFILGADLEANINQRELIMAAAMKKKQETPKAEHDNIDKAKSPKTEHNNNNNNTESPKMESPKMEHIGIQMAHSVLNGIERY